MTFWLLAAVLLYGCARQAAPADTAAISPDGLAGQELREALLSQYIEDADPADQQQVLGVASRLLDAAGDPEGWTVTILIDSSEVNAAAARGKQLFVWTGLLDAVTNDEELAAVLAHEIGHVRAGHVSDIDLGSRYAEKSELEADRIGLELMAQAGYDPRKALRLWRRLDRLASSTKTSGHSEGTTTYVASHPSSARRIRNIELFLPVAEELYGSKSVDGSKNVAVSLSEEK
jgi:predicted Zn-dependent protease